MSFWSSIGNFVGGLFGGGSSAAMNAASAVISNKQQYDYATKLNNQTYQNNLRLQNHQNAFSAQMANSSYQRGIKDMRAAGINPMLAISNGGAMSPVGGSAGMSSASFNGSDYGLGDSVTSALQFRQQRNQDKMTKEQVENLKADSYLKGNQANTESEKFATQTAITKQVNQDIANSIATTAAQVRNLDAQAYAAYQNAVSNRINANSNSAYQSQATKREYYENVERRNRSDFYNTSSGKRLQQTREMFGNVPFMGRAFR